MPRRNLVFEEEQDFFLFGQLKWHKSGSQSGHSEPAFARCLQQCFGFRYRKTDPLLLRSFNSNPIASFISSSKSKEMTRTELTTPKRKERL